MVNPDMIKCAKSDCDNIATHSKLINVLIPAVEELRKEGTLPPAKESFVWSCDDHFEELEAALEAIRTRLRTRGADLQ